MHGPASLRRSPLACQAARMIGLRAAAAFVLVLAAGCGGGGSGTMIATDASADQSSSADTSSLTTDISGWYQVTSDLEGACGLTMPFTLGSPYLWVEHQMSRYVVHACGGSTAADCTGTYFYDFTQPIDNGWRAEGATDFFSAGCTLSLERTDATLAGAELHAHSFTYRVNRDIPQAACTLTAASALTEPCVREVDIRATRL